MRRCAYRLYRSMYMVNADFVQSVCRSFYLPKNTSQLSFRLSMNHDGNVKKGCRKEKPNTTYGVWHTLLSLKMCTNQFCTFWQFFFFHYDFSILSFLLFRDSSIRKRLTTRFFLGWNNFNIYESIHQSFGWFIVSMRCDDADEHIFFLIFYVHCKLILNTYSQTECKRFIKYSLNISKAHPSKYYIFSPLRWNTVNCSELCALQCMCIVHIYIYKFVPWMLLSRAEQLC